MHQKTIGWLFLLHSFVFLPNLGAVYGEVLRIMNWNVANHPNDEVDQADFRTVLGYLGQSRPFDILSMAESDTVSSVDIAAITNSVFGSTWYTSILSSANAAGDRTELLYNASRLQLLSAFELNSASLTERMVRGQFRPIGTDGQSDFFVYSVHLKSGATTGDRAARSAESQIIRNDIDSLGSAAVVLAGDFNWATAIETGPGQPQSAYQVLSVTGEGQVRDPLNQVGDWRDNPAFLSLHTNDPRSAMDDRFDMQLVSGELSDGLGLDYINGSYYVLGNNGTHLLNDTIMTGTGAPTNVLQALSRFSDHLPVVADYFFAPTAVPEPNSILLVSIVVFVVILRRRNNAIALD